jgi:hypothetical protein
VIEMPIPDDEQLAAAAREAARSGQIIYLTDRGQRLAAIVPAHLAALLGQSDRPVGRRVLGARGVGHSGQRDISERIEEPPALRGSCVICGCGTGLVVRTTSPPPSSAQIRSSGDSPLIVLPDDQKS